MDATNIRFLLTDYKKSKHYEKWHPKRNESHAYNHEWINPDKIVTCSDEELKNKFISYYSGGEGRQTFIQIRRDRMIRDVSKFRDMLVYLLDEKIPIEERFFNVVNRAGIKHIDGVGRGLASAFLMSFNLDKYCLWNKKTEMGFNVLGWGSPYQNSDNDGTKYVKVLSYLKKLRDDIGSSFDFDFDEVDNFLHWISAEEEGKSVVKNRINERGLTEIGTSKDTKKDGITLPVIEISEESYQSMLDLLEAKKQIILYGPPGTGKTWLAKKFIEEYHSRNVTHIKSDEFDEIVMPNVDGFTRDSFIFLKNLDQNNSKKWFHQHIDEYRKYVDGPLRSITKAIGEQIRKLDVNFETKPDSHHTISRINRNIYGRTDKDLYYNYMWSAFYRKKIGDKRKDAQLFVSINKDHLRFGFGFGNHQEAQEIEGIFKQNAAEEIDFIFTILKDLNILEDYAFRYNTKQGKWYDLQIKTKNQLLEWLQKENVDIVTKFTEGNLPSGNEQAIEIIRTFKTLYPLYLFATSDNPRQEVEDYLEGDTKAEDYTPAQELSKFVTFHQSYSYEEFVEGIRPDLCGTEGEPQYKLVDGVFKECCIKAEKDERNAYFLIIDEINRGNISKIFGELITCLEKDKRLGPNNIEKENTFPVTLPYSKDELRVPWNLYIIGTMNTADKSIALVDVALRRRFGFIEVTPDVSLIKSINVNGTIVKLPEILSKLNEKISILIDRDHRIGHSYLMNINQNSKGEITKDPEILLKNLKIAFYNEIFPLVTEYFYNDWKKTKLLLKNFVKVEISSDDAQEMFDDANQGISYIDELDDKEFLNALNSLAESEQSA